MQLNAEGRARFQAHLQNVLRNACSLCGTGNWQVEDAIFELREFVGGAVPTEGSVKPLLAMTCNGCGHTVFMSPMKIGIIGAPAAVEQAPQTVIRTEEEETEE